MKILNPANIDLLDIIDVEYTVVYSEEEKCISSPAFKMAKYGQDDTEVKGLLIDEEV